MTFNECLSKLKALNLDPKQFIVVGSGPLGVRSIRECNDIDITVTENLWKTLSQKYPVVDFGHYFKISLDDDIEIVGQDSMFDDPSIASMEEIFKTADTIDGIKYLNLELLKKFKQKMGREKDLKDIELIDNYLNKVK